MSVTIVITEKHSQARDVRAAVGDRFGKILPAQGHLLELKEPEDVNPDWKVWGFDLLRPKEGVYGYKPVRTAASKLKDIKKASKGADHIIVATDPDREGNLIAKEILDHIGFKGKVSRAVFASVDKVTIAEAFKNLRPIAEFRTSFEAGQARQQSDQIFNLTMTRCVSKAFARGGGAVGVGRVKTPTLAIVVRRDSEIENFTEHEFYVIEAEAEQGGSRFVMTHEPKEQIFEKPCAEKIAAAAQGFEGPLAVKIGRKRQGPPKLFDLPRLQRAAAKRWKWSAKKTLEVTQSLYEAQVLTYPRSEVAYLHENQTADIPRLLKGLLALEPFAGVKITEPIIRKGKQGHFCDACLEGQSHSAIIPNVNVAGAVGVNLAKLSDDQRKLFILTAQSWLAALMPDYEYESVTVSAQVSAEGFTVEFRASGRTPLVPGWREAYGFNEEKDSEKLPPLKSKEGVRFTEVNVSTRKTKPPPRYNDGLLIQAMQESWRFVPEDDPALAPLRERLKDAKGIGTPATRDSIIDGLVRQGLLRRDKNALISTTRGRAVIARLTDIAPALTEPAMTAVWEMRFDEIERGKAPWRGVVEGISKEAGGYAGKLKALSESGKAEPLPGLESSGDLGRSEVRRGAFKGKAKGGFGKKGSSSGSKFQKRSKA